MFTHKMRSIPIQCICVEPGVTGESRGRDGKIARGTYEKKDVGMDVGLPC